MYGDLYCFTGTVTDNRATVTINIPGNIAAGSYMLRAQVAGSSSTMSKGFIVNDLVTPAIVQLELNSDHRLEGKGSMVTVTVNTANVSDGTTAQVELTDRNGDLILPLVYSTEQEISGNTAQFNMFIPASIPAGSYQLRVAVETSGRTLMGYGSYTIYPNSLAITSFTVPDQMGDSVIDSGAHTVVFTMPYGYDISALFPTIAFNGESISPASGIAQDFGSAENNTITYTVTTTASDATTVTSSLAWAVTCIVDSAPNTEAAFTAFSLPGHVECVVGIQRVEG